MTVAVMQVRVMRMLVNQRPVPVPMGMRLDCGITRPMAMLMVFVVRMPVFVFHGFVGVLMLVLFGQMQP